MRMLMSYGLRCLRWSWFLFSCS